MRVNPTHIVFSGWYRSKDQPFSGKPTKYMIPIDKIQHVRDSSRNGIDSTSKMVVSVVGDQNNYYLVDDMTFEEFRFQYNMYSGEIDLCEKGRAQALLKSWIDKHFNDRSDEAREAVHDELCAILFPAGGI